ncbi:MAG: hypothetical protein ACRDJH_09600, partial [Thermomicrobiales bacterium]
GGVGPKRVRGVIGCLFGGAMIAAPFLALTYGLTEGLAVMVAALVATTLLAFDAARTAIPEVRPRLTVVAVVNGVLAVAGGVVLVVRVS